MTIHSLLRRSRHALSILGLAASVTFSASASADPTGAPDNWTPMEPGVEVTTDDEIDAAYEAWNGHGAWDALTGLCEIFAEAFEGSELSELEHAKIVGKWADAANDPTYPEDEILVGVAEDVRAVLDANGEESPFNYAASLEDVLEALGFEVYCEEGVSTECNYQAWIEVHYRWGFYFLDAENSIYVEVTDDDALDAVEDLEGVDSID